MQTSCRIPTPHPQRPRWGWWQERQADHPSKPQRHDPGRRILIGWEDCTTRFANRQAKTIEDAQRVIPMHPHYR